MNDLMDKMLNDGGTPFVFTLITPDKFQLIEQAHQAELAPLMKHFRYSSLVQPMSNIALEKAKNDKRPTSDKSLEKFVTEIKDAFAVLEANKDKIIYDSEMEIIFSRTMTRAVCEAIQNSNPYLNAGKTSGINVCIASAGLSELGLVTLGYIYMTLAGHTAHPRIDLGVDNIRRTKSIIGSINSMDILIVTAGMEAILPTVLANMSYRPVIAVPSDVSYGFGAQGHAGLHSILMSDAPGIACFNIGNIFGACTFAHRIAHYIKERKVSGVAVNRKALFSAPVKLFDAESANEVVLHKTSFDGKTTDRTSLLLKKDNNIVDMAHGIRIVYPLMNLNGKSFTRIMDFVQTHQYVIVRDNRPQNSADQFRFSLPGFRRVEGIVFTNVPEAFILKRKQLYDTSKKVLVICGGFADMTRAREFKAYLTLSGIGCDILEKLEMNLAINCGAELRAAMEDYVVVVVIAGTNGTISNIVGGFYHDRPVIAVPVCVQSDEQSGMRTAMSMLNNCVGGITVVSPDNVYGAACLVCSILFKYDGNIDLLFEPKIPSIVTVRRVEETTDNSKEMSKSIDLSTKSPEFAAFLKAFTTHDLRASFSNLPGALVAQAFIDYILSNMGTAKRILDASDIKAKLMELGLVAKECPDLPTSFVSKLVLSQVEHLLVVLVGGEGADDCGDFFDFDVTSIPMGVMWRKNEGPDWQWQCLPGRYGWFSDAVSLQDLCRILQEGSSPIQWCQKIGFNQHPGERNGGYCEKYLLLFMESQLKEMEQQGKITEFFHPKWPIIFDKLKQKYQDHLMAGSFVRSINSAWVADKALWDKAFTYFEGLIPSLDTEPARVDFLKFSLDVCLPMSQLVHVKAIPTGRLNPAWDPVGAIRHLLDVWFGANYMFMGDGYTWSKEAKKGHPEWLVSTFENLAVLRINLFPPPSQTSLP